MSELTLRQSVRQQIGVSVSIWTRRKVLAAGAATTLSAACSGGGINREKRVAVIGGGIIGASIAYHLSKLGAQVTVLERHEVATRASRGTFAWLNATWAKQPRHYHKFNQLGLAGWQELERELDIPIKWGGSIEWFSNEGRQTQLVNQIAEQVEWGEPARMVDIEELRGLEPNVVFQPGQTAAFSPNDGALDPVLATNILMAAAQKLGAIVNTNCAVKAVRTLSDGVAKVLETDQGDVECETFVLATGADPEATKALGGVDIPQRSTPGVIAVTQPLEPMLNRIVVAPGVHIHQRSDGRVVLGEQQGAPQTQAHAMRLADRPNRFPSREISLQHADRILSIAETYVPAIAQSGIDDVYIGWRPLPLDGHPVLGLSPAEQASYFAISHSGVSLATIIGRIAAQYIMEGIQVEGSSNYRPDRSFELVRRY